MATKLQCLACGQMYQLGRDNPPWPPCRACQGELAPLLEELEVVEEPAPLSDDSALLGLSDANPLAAGPSPLMAKPRPSTGNGLPVIAILGIAGGGIALVMVLLVVAVWSFASRPVAQVSPPPPIVIDNFPAPEQPRPPSPINKSNPSPTPSPKPSPSPTPSPAERPAVVGGPIAPRNEGGKIGTIRSGTGRLQEGFSGDEAFQPRVAWSMKLDPVEPAETPATDRLIDIDFKTRVDKLVFPERPSPFFAAATDDFRNPEIRIFDWRTGRSGRKFPGKLNHSQELSALSADGEQMTTVVSKGGDTGIIIVETKTGKAIHTIGIEDRSTVKTLAFAGPSRFIAVVHSHSGKSENRVGIWNLEDGSVLADFAVESPEKKRFGSPQIEPGSLAVSPGGKYFTLLIDKFLCCYEVETGNLIGETKLTTNDSTYNAALSFSPDGSEIVLMTGHSVDGALLYRIDAATGETLGSAKINATEFKDAHYYQNLGRIQFLPDIKCYLIDGAFIVEQTTGETLFRLDAFKGMARVFDSRRVAGIAARANSAGFAEARLPKEELEKLAAVFQGGGKLLDGLWGEAKVGEVDTTRALRLPAQMTEWTLPAWEPPAKVTGKKVVSLPMATDSNYSWQYDAPIFSTTAKTIAWLPRNERVHSRLFAVDVVSGRAEGDIDMLPGTRAIDISPDGSLVIAGFGKRSHYSSSGTYERLEVFSIPLKKHVFAWRQSGAIENTPANSAGRNANLFKEAYFIEKTLVLTLMENGRLVLWKLPEATAQWKLEGDIAIVDFSPDRSFVQLYLRAQGKYSWLDVRTGEWKGDMRAGERWNNTALAISPDRARTASLMNLNGYSQLALRNVADPDGEGTQFDIPSVSGPLTWLNDRYLLALGTGVVLDANNGAPVWRVKGTSQMRRSPEGTYWLSSQSKGETALTRTAFPSDKLLAKLKTARSEPIKPLVGPGSRVAVQGGFDSDPQSQERIKQVFEERGWILDPNGPFRISGSASQQPGRTQEYQNMLTREKQSVSIPGATLIQINLTDATGNVLWKTEYQTGGGGYAPSMVTLREGESLQDKVGGNQGNSPRPEIASVPAMIFPAKTFDNLPGMMLSEKGEQY